MQIQIGDGGEFILEVDNVELIMFIAWKFTETIFMQYLTMDTVYLEFIQQLVFVITQSELDMLTI